MKLIIIEGAGKQATIEKYLGNEYKVFATKGHIRDLPPKTFGVDIKKNFEPRYDILPDKKEVVERLKRTVKSASKVYLATDPDREGEAISWHLANILGVDTSSHVRIVFNEISKKAVHTALNNPRALDINLVDAQQARRVLDRIVGYKLSPLLSKKIQSKLSAGRVQSVTLRIIVEREREILAFVPQEYWTFFSVLETESDDPARFKASLHSKQGVKIKLTNKQQVDEVLSDIEGHRYTVTKVKKSVTTQKPPAPFVTSTMQQDALNKLSMTLKQTSMTAQSLYEGVELGADGNVALVTYIRTDSTRVSSDAQAEAKSYIVAKYGAKYAPSQYNVYTSKKGNVQDAHEAIRPIDLDRTPESVKPYLQPSQYKLYKLIYERFLASQMTAAQYNSVSLDIDCNNYNFRATGRTLLFDGYTIVYNNFVEKKDDDDTNVVLPELNEGDTPLFVEYKYEQKFTKPPARYNEASIVKKMEECGIGRPATYTPTIATLISRKYVEKEGKVLVPTQLGFDCTDMLVKYFPDIMDTEFTAGMEQTLDNIEEGGKVWQQVISDFYAGFATKLDVAMGDGYSLKEADEETDFDCPKCNSMMIIKSGRYGKFLSCSGYPACKHIMNIGEDGQPKEKEAAVVSDQKCDKCGSDMLERKGRYGKFLGCSSYPKCKNIVNVDTAGDDSSENDASVPAKEVAVVSNQKCDKCGSDMLERKGRYGKFLGCSGYPKCKNIVKLKNN